jgi:hypothetical protein
MALPTCYHCIREVFSHRTSYGSPRGLSIRTRLLDYQFRRSGRPLFQGAICNSRAPPRHSFKHGSSGLRGPPLATSLPRPPHWHCFPFLGTSCVRARGVMWCADVRGQRGPGVATRRARRRIVWQFSRYSSVGYFRTRRRGAKAPGSVLRPCRGCSAAAVWCAGVCVRVCALGGDIVWPLRTARAPVSVLSRTEHQVCSTS